MPRISGAGILRYDLDCYLGPFLYAELRRKNHLPALPGVAVEHVAGVQDNLTEHPIVIGASNFGIVTVLHGPAEDDIILPAEHVHGPVIRAAAAEEIELLREGPSQDNKVAALGEHLTILCQKLCPIAGAIDDDVFSEFRKRLHIAKHSPSKRYAASPQIRNQSRQQDGWIDQPRAVFAARNIEAAERKRSGPGFRHHVNGRMGVEFRDLVVEGIIVPERNSIVRPARGIP